MSNISIDDKLLGNIGDKMQAFANLASDFLASGGFINRMLDQANSFEDIQFLMQALGYEPITLLGKDYAFIYDHVRRNVIQGEVSKNGKDYKVFPNFTFYDGKPTIRFADVELDPLTFFGNWSTDHSFGKTLSKGTEFSYAESTIEGEEDRSVPSTTINMGYESAVQSIGKDDTPNLLNKTNQLFKSGKIDTLVARFHSNKAYTKAKDDPTQTAITEKYGMSHGRNLLAEFPSSVNTYDNPYCRVWTYHHQYKELKDMIRPFSVSYNDGSDAIPTKLSQLYGEYNWKTFRNTEGSSDNDLSDRFTNNSVLDTQNGLVNIAPTVKVVEYSDGAKTNDGSTTIKKCMFSIENLAWKDTKFDPNTYDVNGLSAEQKGPFGGRIMWFPPYDLTFSEDVSVNWNESSFIGRGEKIYSYTNTDRSGQLSFSMVIDHPSILDYWGGRDNDRVKDLQAFPDDISSSDEQSLLRFFAGCQYLDAKDHHIPISENKKKEEESKTYNNKAFNGDPITVNEGTKGNNVIIFAAYFPNNYSGKDDAPQDAIKYLLNGVGTQHFYVNWQDLDMISGIPMDVSAAYNGDEVGGYEVGVDTVSLLASQIDPNKIPETLIREGHLELFSGSSENPLQVTYGADGENLPLLKQIGDEAITSTKRNTLDWYRKRWFYRVDKNTANDDLSTENNYVDGKSYLLNSNGYTNGADYIDALQVKGENEKLISLVDMYVGIHADAKAISSLANSKNVKLVQKLKNNPKVIKRIVYQGFASPQSNSKKSDSNQLSLAKSRASTLKGWLEKELGDSLISGETDGTVAKFGANAKTNDVDDKEMKIWRSAYVRIEYNEEELQNLNGENVGKTYSSVDNGNATSSSIENTNTMSAKRYDNEGEFFEKLKLNDPLIYSMISKKIRYFNPAFHSISPEGFQSRLTFLHQCTRQGPTNGNSSFGGVANNLAFGRPPVCVLRIGDFYYTKVVFTHIGISYENPQWDLNQEGIGVMPMFAKVDLTFNFLGGSDLTGPISRLQNALSFNYYANTSVYDNRAERVTYDDKGNMTNFEPFIRDKEDNDDNES